MTKIYGALVAFALTTLTAASIVFAAPSCLTTNVADENGNVLLQTDSQQTDGLIDPDFVKSFTHQADNCTITVKVDSCFVDCSRSCLPAYRCCVSCD